MSFIKELRKIGQKGGSLLRKAAPVVGLIPGVGTIAGAGLGALGSIAEGHRGLGGTLTSAGIGGLSGFGGSKLREMLANRTASKVAGGLAGRVPGDGLGAVNTGKLGALSGAIGSLGGLAGFAADHAGGIASLAKYALPAVGAYQASKSAGKADDYRKKAIALTEQQWADQAPLRTMGMAGLTDPRLADVSSIYNAPRPQFRPFVDPNAPKLQIPGGYQV